MKTDQSFPEGHRDIPTVKFLCHTDSRCDPMNSYRGIWNTCLFLSLICKFVASFHLKCIKHLFYNFSEPPLIYVFCVICAQLYNPARRKPTINLPSSISNEGLAKQIVLPVTIWCTLINQKWKFTSDWCNQKQRLSSKGF